MCNPDTSTVYGSVWINPAQPSTFFDFSSTQQCRNFEDLRGWVQLHQVRIPTENEREEPTCLTKTVI